ncbi:MAG TPA: PDZ domain-containing protein [Candidatus Eremiobacteraceae bacterium]|jgi:tricorn protease
MKNAGYYRCPTINGDTIVFACEDDLWSVETTGGIARRLTAGRGDCIFPRFSPDGASIAFVGRDEWHPEVFVMPAGGGAARRLTFLGAEVSTVNGWTTDGKSVVFTTDARVPFLRNLAAYTVPADGGEAKSLDLGHVATIALARNGAIVIGRNNLDAARWKRYRGGTAGDLWIDAAGKGTFKRLISVNGNPSWPMFVADRVYFVSDHEGVGNIYSCTPDGSGLKRHTDHADYYVRFPSTDGSRIVYTAGSKIYVYDHAAQRESEVAVEAPSSTPQRARRFVDAAPNLEHFAPHPEGHSLALIARGQPYAMPNWEEGVTHLGTGSRIRYRMSEWLHDGERVVFVDDADGFERVRVVRADGSSDPDPITQTDIGRVIEMVASPVADVVALSNHRQELLLVDVTAKTIRTIDRSPHARIADLAFSPDGRWIAYSWETNADSSIIRIADTSTGEIHDVTTPLRVDRSPAFDPDGKFLFFLSTRDFNPIYDALQFDLGFPHAMRPFLVTLTKDAGSPFVPKLKPVVKRRADEKKEEPQSTAPSAPVAIDFDGISTRVVGFPVEEGRYDRIAGLKGRAVFTSYPVRGSLESPWMDPEGSPEGSLIAYDFDEQTHFTIASDVVDFRVASDHRTVAYRSGKQLRVIDALDRSGDQGERRRAPRDPGRRTGWVDLGRINVEIDPVAEWAQMYDEAWRLQREQFWDERMTHVDWQLVHDRYGALLPRLRTRGELSDLIWEMQGELGTSHAYEMGGDYRTPPQYKRGFLGADLSWDPSAGGYRIDRILRGDSWDRTADSPLAEPGLGIAEGDVIVAVGGQPVSATRSPDELLVNSADTVVALTLAGGPDRAKRRVAVHTLKGERSLRYRAWVNANRDEVHRRTNGRVGYLHIPDMGPWGFAEFHRGYLSEFDRDALIVDVRFNRGGHVSSLLLEKLARKRVGYDVSRWGVPRPYPPESVRGPMVGLTNQFAGSDGDIFSHCFKLYKLGPLVGKRTWGGVIGIWPRHPLVDGTVTTQPEFSFWFTDVGWNVENYGTDPDYDVDIAPHDSHAGRDPQMDKALELALSALESNATVIPDFADRPSLPIPTSLPPRK